MAADSDSSSSLAKGVSKSLTVALFCGVALLRILVGFQPHSGQDNYHGLHAAYGGDFEAQRHWMELTLHLPAGEWYWYDLFYWGLDYPPLTAYVSWVCGYLSARLVGPETVAFETSRGIEDPVHKAYMRATVLVLDLLIYGTVAWILTRSFETNSKHTRTSIWSYVLVMAQPAILLIDHGHFQYNTTALGLSLWAFYFMTKCEMKYWVIGSVFFCLALSFKQMTLYYAPVVGCYLLGRCFSDQGRQIVRRISMLGVTVIICFGLLWWPFIVYGPEDKGYLERLHHVLRRIIPLQRGLFEGKVSNLWCALSVRPLRLRQRIPVDIQPMAALSLTAVLMLPSCYRLFCIGQATTSAASSSSTTRTHRTALLWGATSCALAFFLASFQVHEKSLLLALAPASFLLLQDTTFVDWFSLVTAWTLWPLVVVDRLQVAYVCTILMFLAILQLRTELIVMVARNSRISVNPFMTSGFFEQNVLFRWIPPATHLVMCVLHGAEMLVSPPPNLPDLFPVLWSMVGCGFCCIAYVISCWHLYGDAPRRHLVEKEKSA